MTQSSQLLSLSHIATESQWTILFGRMVSGFGIGMEGAVLGTIKKSLMGFLISPAPLLSQSRDTSILFMGGYKI